MASKIARFLVVNLLRLVARIEVFGLEHVPASGAFVAASNHIGRLDAGFVYCLLDREDIIMMVAEKYRTNPVYRWLTKSLNAFFVDRFNADLKALRTCLRRLERGGVLVLAPEGTRSPTGALQEARAGVSYLAVKAGVPVVPVGLTGTEDAVVKARLKRLQRLHVTIRVGEPFILPPIGEGNRDDILQQHTDEIMCRIAAQLPASHRGAYAEHPRLLELLDGNREQGVI